MLIAVLRRVGGVAVLVEGNIAHPVHGILDAPVPAQPVCDHAGSGVLERQAADRVDDLDRALAGGGDQAFAGDPDDLFDVGKADTPGCGDDLLGACLDAAVAAGVVGDDDGHCHVI